MRRIRFIGLVLVMLIILVNGGIVLAQEPSPTGRTGLFFSPLMHRISINQNDIRNLRQKGENLRFDVTVGNNYNQPLSFRTSVGHLTQYKGMFMRAKLSPKADIYKVKPEETTNPEATLRAVSKRLWGDEELYVLLTRFNQLEKEFQLPDVLLIPHIKPVRYTVQPGDLLSQIARNFYGDEKMATLIAEINGLTKPYQLYEGQSLFIVTVKEERYVVKEDGVLKDIVQELFDDPGLVPLVALANNLSPPYKVSQGNKLVLPDIKRKYIVQAGEDLETIAANKDIYGDEAAAIVIAKANDLEQSYMLAEGEILFIPNVRQRRYVIQAGDSLEGISAKMYGDTGGAWLIARVNGIIDPRSLPLGQDLYIPEMMPFEFSCAPWITAEEGSFTLDAHEYKRVFFEVQIPSVAIIGTYSAIVGVAIAVETESEDEGIQSVMIPGGHCTVILHIEGRRPQSPRAELSSFEIKSKTIQGIEVMILAYGLKNLGRTMFQVKESTISLLKEDRSALYPPMPLGQGLRLVLPGNAVHLETGIVPLPPGTYFAQGTVDYGGRTRAFMETEFTIREDEVKVRARTISFLVTSREEGKSEVVIPVQLGRRNVRGEGIRVQNLEIEPIHCQVRIVDISGLDPKFSAKNMFSVRPAEFDLAPLSSRNIQLILKDPSPTPGGRYAQVQILGSLKSKEGLDIYQAKMLPSIRTIDVFEESQEGLLYGVAGSGLEAEFQDGILLLKISLQNTGNIHVMPETNLFITDSIGQMVYSAKLNLPDYIYPSEEKILEPQINLSTEDTIKAGKHGLQILFKHGGAELSKLSSEFVVPEDYSPKVGETIRYSPEESEKDSILVPKSKYKEGEEESEEEKE